MTAFKDLRTRAVHLAREACDWRSGAFPVSGVLRGGFTVGASFLAFRLLGRVDGAVIAALFTNLLCLADRARSLRPRLWVMGTGALLSACAGATGASIAGNHPVILLVVFALAAFAGFIHGTLPGVEAIPRNAIVCFIAAAYLPIDLPETLVPLVTGTAFAMIAVWIDHSIRHDVRSPRIARANEAVVYPGPRFSIAYGTAAASALGIGLISGQSRPYWITITTLLVMQPDRRANMVRVIQRFVGTILGVLLAFAIVKAVPDAMRPTVLLGLALGLPFLWPFGFDRNYGFGVALLSLWILLLIDLASPPSDIVVPLFFARLSDTAIGCAVALCGSLFVFETRDAQGEG
ncbi:MAG: FUSC family protein [Beijerinckiaceae bacterium]|nr:FUSC family protein [Beijerinckiaceae bacterium]